MVSILHKPSALLGKLMINAFALSRHDRENDETIDDAQTSPSMLADLARPPHRSMRFVLEAISRRGAKRLGSGVFLLVLHFVGLAFKFLSPE
jgi:hypothetical protein